MPVNTSQDSEPVSVRHVAVYGTLRKGQRNDINLLRPPVAFVGLAQLFGRLYDLDLYPGLVLDDDAGHVVCEVYAVSPEVEAAMDELEATYPAQPDEYAKRERTLEVSTAQGLRKMRCFFYEMNPAYVQGKPVIASGDWVVAAASGKRP